MTTSFALTCPVFDSSRPSKGHCVKKSERSAAPHRATGFLRRTTLILSGERASGRPTDTSLENARISYSESVGNRSLENIIPRPPF
ncbi:hypothetical protein VTN49DRAFT_4160 [Thermomyces lanuginosus]|uniref:uncharacterized protein n=1 Tax=Thermomyces lanuginosus TaxID=5541 RepID=UPI003743C10A